MQFLKGTKLYSVLTGTCPVCHKGKMYVEPNPYKLSKVLQMHDRCSHCDIKFKMEPSFFYGGNVCKLCGGSGSCGCGIYNRFLFYRLGQTLYISCNYWGFGNHVSYNSKNIAKYLDQFFYEIRQRKSGSLSSLFQHSINIHFLRKRHIALQRIKKHLGQQRRH